MIPAAIVVIKLIFDGYAASSLAGQPLHMSGRGWPARLYCIYAK